MSCEEELGCQDVYKGELTRCLQCGKMRSAAAAFVTNVIELVFTNVGGVYNCNCSVFTFVRGTNYICKHVFTLVIGIVL